MQDLRDRKRKTAVRTAASVRRRPLVIELHPTRPYELLIREQGRRAASGYWVGFESIFAIGAKQKAEADRAERLAAKKAAKAGRKASR